MGGGKGGVGKTFVTANLATSLARLGKRVIVVDVDLEGANLHTCLGVPTPQRSLADFVSERVEDLAKLVVDTPVPNLQLIGATHGNLADALEMKTLGYGDAQNIYRSSRIAPFKIII